MAARFQLRAAPKVTRYDTLIQIQAARHNQPLLKIVVTLFMFQSIRVYHYRQ